MYNTNYNNYNHTNEYDTIYDDIYNNLPIILNYYHDIFSPHKNNTTQRYLNNGYGLNEAYTLSIMTTLLLYSQIQK